ncbi:hypothetical protein KC336_g79 [Hortaea werneckii]|nr:hypothetical protein KC336_g79 [Hortaea werneckii]
MKVPRLLSSSLPRSSRKVSAGRQEAFAACAAFGGGLLSWLTEVGDKMGMTEARVTTTLCSSARIIKAQTSLNHICDHGLADILCHPSLCSSQVIPDYICHTDQLLVRSGSAGVNREGGRDFVRAGRGARSSGSVRRMKSGSWIAPGDGVGHSRR